MDGMQKVKIRRTGAGINDFKLWIGETEVEGVIEFSANCHVDSFPRVTLVIECDLDVGNASE